MRGVGHVQQLCLRVSNIAWCRSRVRRINRVEVRTAASGNFADDAPAVETTGMIQTALLPSPSVSWLHSVRCSAPARTPAEDTTLQAGRRIQRWRSMTRPFRTASDEGTKS